MPEPGSKMDTPPVYQADGRIGNESAGSRKDFRQTWLPSCRATWHAIGAIEQLGLFDSATSHLPAARRALGRFDLDGAERGLVEHARVFGGDQTAQSLSDIVRLLRVKRDAAARHGTELEALVELRSAVPADLLPGWHFRIAELAENQRGRARVAGEPIGFHWLAAGQHARAIESLRAALAFATADSRARAVLADVLYLSGERESARREYLGAFMDDPGRVAVERIADPDVARLAHIARYEYELDEPAAAWIPPVGIVERVFALPQVALPGLTSVSTERAAPLAFVDLIARERAGRTLDERVTVRRRMRALAPTLFDAYLRAFA